MKPGSILNSIKRNPRTHLLPVKTDRLAQLWLEMDPVQWVIDLWSLQIQSLVEQQSILRRYRTAFASYWCYSKSCCAFSSWMFLHHYPQMTQLLRSVGRNFRFEYLHQTNHLFPLFLWFLVSLLDFHLIFASLKSSFWRELQQHENNGTVSSFLNEAIETTVKAFFSLTTKAFYRLPRCIPIPPPTLPLARQKKSLPVFL